jgi:hypothetical protein
LSSSNLLRPETAIGNPLGQEIGSLSVFRL